ncbi:MAG: glycine--tRNA ligase subunit alpha [Holosporales bacterium]|jgi:glycyl-tRNA synthetase alpha chain|nr:glycine--tRNA ligase subunit alpha [Holosporales bacterium]
MSKEKVKSFQDIIFDLQKFWASYGCVIIQPYDTEVGAGTSHPSTTLKALGDDFWNVAFVQPCRRPKDGRYAENPNRTQYYYQFQVILKPAPINSQDLYLQSLEAIGFDLSAHDIRFVEDDWENPSLGAAGLGWEVWCDGTEITQYTYFQQIGGILCSVTPVEITYGLERIATFMQNVESHFAINWNGQRGDKKLTYGNILKRFEKEFSCYNFDVASIDLLLEHFNDYEKECLKLLSHNLVMPAYEQCIKANHCFNLLDARGVVSVTERAGYIARVRALAKSCCQAWIESL